MLIILGTASTAFYGCEKKPSEPAVYYIDKDTVFPIDLEKSSVLGVPFSIMLEPASCITLCADGTASIFLQFKSSIGGLINILLMPNLDKDFLLTPFIEMLLDYIPGFDLYDMSRSFNLVNACLGLSLFGFDWNDPDVKAMFTTIAETGKLPDRLSLPKTLTMEYNASYYFKDVASPYTGTYTGVYMGNHSDNGEPFILLDLSIDENNVRKLNLRIELVKFIINATEA